MSTVRARRELARASPAKALDVTFQRALDAENIVLEDVNIPLEHGAQTGPPVGKRASRVAEAPPAARALGARRRDRSLGLENTLASELTPRMQSVTSEPALSSTFIRVVALRAAKGCTRPAADAVRWPVATPFPPHGSEQRSVLRGARAREGALSTC